MWATRFLRAVWAVLVVGVLAALSASALAQELGGAGTVQGIVKDPTGGVMQAVTVVVNNPVSGFRRDTTTDGMGRFVFRNLPPNPYRLEVTAQGFMSLTQNVDVRSAVPIELTLSLQLAGATASVDVVGSAGDLVERDPTAHTDIDQSVVSKMSLETTGGLNQVITNASPGVVADSERLLSSDWRSRADAVLDRQPAGDGSAEPDLLQPDLARRRAVDGGDHRGGAGEYGDKSSLVVQIITKSGLGQPKPTGSASLSYGSFTSPSVNVDLGGGSPKVGDFVSFSGVRTDRFLDPPEFSALHDTGDSQSFFNRLDVHPNDLDTFHLNLQLARSSFDVPNTYDQAAAGSGAAPEHHHVQRRAGLLPRDRVEDALHGEWLRPSGSPDVSAERQSVRRSTCLRESGPHADEHGHQGGPRLLDGEPQPEGRRHRRRHQAP